MENSNQKRALIQMSKTQYNVVFNQNDLLKITENRAANIDWDEEYQEAIYDWHKVVKDYELWNTTNNKSFRLDFTSNS